MSKNVLETIHELNRRNHARVAHTQGPSHRGPSQTRAETPSTSSESPSESALLREFEDEFSTALKQRVDRVLERFAEHVKHLGPDEGGRSVSKHLEATQEIRYSEKSDGESATLAPMIAALQEKFDKLQTSLSTSQSKGALDNAVIERSLEDLADSTSHSIRDAFAELKRNLEDFFAEAAPPAPLTTATPSLPAGLSDTLQSVSEHFQAFQEQASPSAGVDSELTQQLGSIEGLINELTSKVEELSVATPAPAAVEVDLTDQIARFEAALEQHRQELASSSDGTTAPAASGGDSGGDAVGGQVENLRQDFSLLVHTINSHLEENAALSEEFTRLREQIAGIGGSSEGGSGPSIDEWKGLLAETIRESISAPLETQTEQLTKTLDGFLEELKVATHSLEVAADEGETGSVQLERVERALAQVEELSALPTKIASILATSEESQQAGLNAAMQDAVDSILGRLDEMMQRLG